MLKIDIPIVVEGKYDKMKVSSVVEGNIIETQGFGIFKSTELKEYLKRESHNKGIIILTDSDKAGLKIRSYIKSFCGEDAKIYNVYLPEIEGKERRKQKMSAQGILGVEGMERELIRKNLLRFTQSVEDGRKLTPADLFKFKLTGSSDSSERRKRILKRLGLPSNLNSNSLLKVLNTSMTYDKAIKLLEEEKEQWQ